MALSDEEMQRLVVTLSADMRRYQKETRRLITETDRAAGRVEKRFTEMEDRVNRIGAGFGRTFRQAVAGIGTAYLAREAQQLADAYTEAGNRIAAAEQIFGGQLATQRELADLAARTRTEFRGTVDLYTRMARAAGQFGGEQEDVLRFTELLNKAMVAGGASTSERDSSILQLSQGLASGQLQGDELRTVRESAPLVAQAIADAMDTSIGGLKELGAQGEITSEIIFNAVLEASGGIEAAFGATEKTVSDAFTNLRTAAIVYIGSADDAVSATEKLVGFLDYAASNIDVFAEAAVVAATVIGGTFAGKAMIAAVASLTALHAGLGRASVGFTGYTVATLAAARAMGVLRASMAFMAGPWGAVIMGIAASFAYMAGEARSLDAIVRRADGAMESLSRVNADIEADKARLEGLSEDLAKAIRAEGDSAEDTARREIAAIEDRIAKNKELRGVYEAQARMALDEAQSAVSNRERMIANRFAPPEPARRPGGSTRDRYAAGMDNFDGILADARAAQDAGEALTNQQRDAIEAAALLADEQLKLADAQERHAAVTGQTEAESARRSSRAGNERLDRLNAEMDAAHALALARAREDQAAVDRLEDREAVQKRIADLQQANPDLSEDDARSRATEEIAEIRAATNAVRDREAAEKAAREAARRRRESTAESRREEDARFTREMLGLEVELARARASGDEQGIDGLERRIEVLRRTRDFEQAGIENAAELASEEQRNLEFAEMALEVEKAIADAIERQRDLTRDQIDFQLQLARARGDDAEVQNLERKLYIMEQIRDLEGRAGRPLTDGETGRAEQAAGGDFDELQRAEARGAFKDAFTSGLKGAFEELTKGDGRRAALEFGGAIAEHFTERSLDALADQAYDLIFGGAKQIFDGASQGQLAAGPINTAFVTGGTSAAGAIAAAMTTAGAAAAAQMAIAMNAAGISESGFNFASNLIGLPGLPGREHGGAVRAGQAVLVGEKRPEVFIPSGSGTIVPRAPMGGGSQAMQIKLEIEENEMFASRVETIAVPIAGRAAQGAVQVSRQTIPAEMAQRQRRRLR